MATLVLNTVGTAIGGPIGGALGSLVGQSIDRQLFGPGLRKGPRLGDLSVQTSSYGSPIPRIYGTMRVAGSVIWATDIQEHEAIEGGGKGSPEYLAYRYSASFAVALSSRPIRSVKRIWADGKLIRGAAGDFKVKTKFRMLDGSEDQPIDPLAASVETIARTPAYRGVALALFEGLALGEFGNRIPMLTFEVEADDVAVALGDLLADASDGMIVSTASRTIGGFAAHGSSVGNALSDLIGICGLTLAERDGALRSPPPSPVRLVKLEELGAGIESVAAIERNRTAGSSTPNSLTLGYYETGRDYQAGQMRASSGHVGIRDDRIELPAVLTGEEAKALAESALARRWSAGDWVKVHLPPTRLNLRPGDTIRLPGLSRVWIVRSVSIEGLAVAIEADAAPTDVLSLPADPGRPTSQPDRQIGRSELALFELPATGEAPSASPIVILCASNAGAWKSLPVDLILGGTPLTAMALGRRAALGRAETALGKTCPAIADERSNVMVRLANPSQVLLSADDEALASGANLAILGDELIQFGRANLLSTGLYELSRLLRGRRGTEWAAASHSIGEPFCLIDAANLRPVELPQGATGNVLKAIAHGIGDASPLPTAARTISGEASRPLPPCHVRLWRDGLAVRSKWVRRSQRGWAWVDEIGDPDDGYPELYRVTLTGPAGAIQLETAVRQASWILSELPAVPGQRIALSVVTIAPLSASRPATTSLVL